VRGITNAIVFLSCLFRDGACGRVCCCL